MKCAICISGTTAPGRTTVTLDRGGTTIVFRDVPADVCTTCGEAYTDSATTAALLTQAEAAIKAGVTVEVRSFAA